MTPYLLAIILCAATAVPVSAAGWNDYQLDIAPGFSVYRMNSFEICLGTPEGDLLICPFDYPGLVGPLVEYAVTNDAIFTRHLGVRPHPKNPSMSQGDPARELFFRVRRSDHRILGPLSQSEWNATDLPSRASLEWIRPKNPNFWVPLLGSLFVLGFMAVYFGWPVLLVLAVGFSWWLYRRRASRVGV